MKSCVQTFEIGIDRLREFLTATEQEQELTNILLAEPSLINVNGQRLLAEIVQKRTHHKQYIYAVSIVSLYGLLERLVDTIIDKFVTSIAKTVTVFDDMPHNIRKNHFIFSLDLAKAMITEERRKSDG